MFNQRKIGLDNQAFKYPCLFERFPLFSPEERMLEVFSYSRKTLCNTKITQTANLFFFSEVRSEGFGSYLASKRENQTKSKVTKSKVQPEPILFNSKNIFNKNTWWNFHNFYTFMYGILVDAFPIPNTINYSYFLDRHLSLSLMEGGGSIQTVRWIITPKFQFLNCAIDSCFDPSNT